ncbi:MAG: hypothetical protein PUB85_01225 [Clostridia bacterium]|nr:hypothetical protein [Clostridia bacterium]
MLGKLVKNEIKASAHTMANIYIAALVTIGIMLLAYLVDINWLSGLATIALIFIAIIALIITFVGVIANFYKTLYGPQGYLSFTLPVSSSQLLASKAIVAFLWMIVSYAVSIALFIGVYMYVTSLIGENNIEMIKMVINMFRSLPTEVAIKEYLVLMLFVVFIQLAFLISELFFAITFANTRVLQKLGAAAPIIVFFAVYIICQICIFLMTSYVPITVAPGENGLVFSMGETMMQSGGMSMGISGVIFELLATAGLFVATGWLMKEKVNIK